MSEHYLRSRYGEGCAMSHALSLVGDRWMLLVVRELMFSGKRFAAIRAGLPGITASVLTTRLADLGRIGLLTHDPELGVYALTDDGRALLPVLLALGEWGVGRAGHDLTLPISPTALMMSMFVMALPEQAATVRDTFGLELGRESFEVSFDADGRPVVKATREPAGAAMLGGHPNVVAAVLYSGAPVQTWLDGGQLGIRGDVAAAQRFTEVFATLAPPVQA